MPAGDVPGRTFSVHVSRSGEFQIDNGPAVSPLIWCCGEERIELATASVELVEARVEDASGKGTRLFTRWRGAVWEADIGFTCYGDPVVIRIDGSLGTARRVDDPVHTVRWNWAAPAQTGDGTVPPRAYTVQGVRQEEQSGFPVSFLERFELMRARRRYRWQAEPAFPSAHPCRRTCGYRGLRYWMMRVAACIPASTGPACGRSKQSGARYPVKVHSTCWPLWASI